MSSVLDAWYAWASQKSFRPKDEPPSPSVGGRNPEVDFRGEKRSNATHLDEQPGRAAGEEGQHGCEALLRSQRADGEPPWADRDTEVEHVSGTAERDSALAMLERMPHREGDRTVGADKHYDTKDFVEGCRSGDSCRTLAQNITALRKSAIDARTTSHPGYEASQRRRKLVEQSFGWTKTVGLLGKLRHRGKPRVQWVYAFTAAAYNLRTLIGAGVCP